MAMAYEFYQDVDPNFANTCLNAAKKAWDFLEENPKLIYENPEDITTGAYEDTSDTDERYWAAMQSIEQPGTNPICKTLSVLLRKLAWTGQQSATMATLPF